RPTTRRAARVRSRMRSAGPKPPSGLERSDRICDTNFCCPSLSMKKNLVEQIPEHIRALAGYVPGKSMRQAQRESGARMVKLASNENPFGPSPLAIEAMRAAVTEVNLYPDNDASELRTALAARHNLQPEHIFIADGSLGILDVLARTLLVPGRKCVSSER